MFQNYMKLEINFLYDNIFIILYFTWCHDTGVRNVNSETRTYNLKQIYYHFRDI